MNRTNIYACGSALFIGLQFLTHYRNVLLLQINMLFNLCLRLLDRCRMGHAFDADKHQKRVKLGRQSTVMAEIVFTH